MCPEHMHTGAETGLELPRNLDLPDEIIPEIEALPDSTTVVEVVEVVEEIDNKKTKLLELITNGASNSNKTNEGGLTFEALISVNDNDGAILTMAKKGLANADKGLSEKVIQQLIDKYGTDQESIKVLHEQIMNNDFKAAMDAYAILVKNNTSGEGGLDIKVFGQEGVDSLKVITEFITKSKDVLQEKKTYKIRVPTPISDFIGPFLVKFGVTPAEVKYREAKFEFEIGGSINQLNELIENKPELDKILAGMFTAEEDMIESYSEKYKTYIALRYILITTLENIKILESNGSEVDLDKLGKAMADEKVRELTSMAEGLINQIAYMENFAVLEFMNAKQAKVTAGRVDADYKMMQFLLADSITSYERNENLLKGVNLGMAVKDANLSLMKQGLSNMTNLLGRQIEISIGADEFARELNTSMKLHIAKLDKLRLEEKNVKANQVKSLEDLVVTAEELKKLENSGNYSIITPPKQSK